MSDIVIVELQAIAGALLIAKRTLDDVLARVTINPGPAQDPAAHAALTGILGTSQLIAADVEQIQAVATGLPEKPSGGARPRAGRRR